MKKIKYNIIKCPFIREKKLNLDFNNLNFNNDNHKKLKNYFNQFKKVFKINLI